jgi:hypothetical protein
MPDPGHTGYYTSLVLRRNQHGRIRILKKLPIEMFQILVDLQDQALGMGVEIGSVHALDLGHAGLVAPLVLNP